MSNEERKIKDKIAWRKAAAEVGDSLSVDPTGGPGFVLDMAEKAIDKKKRKTDWED